MRENRLFVDASPDPLGSIQNRPPIVQPIGCTGGDRVRAVVESQRGDGGPPYRRASQDVPGWEGDKVIEPAVLARMIETRNLVGLGIARLRDVVLVGVAPWASPGEVAQLIDSRSAGREAGPRHDVLNVERRDASQHCPLSDAAILANALGAGANQGSPCIASGRHRVRLRRPICGLIPMVRASLPPQLRIAAIRRRAAATQ